MTLCDKCGEECGNLFCGKCKSKVRKKLYKQAPKETDNLLPIIYWDKEIEMYRFGCTVRECPANKEGVCCTPRNSILFDVHEFDGDNCIKQFCG